MRIELQLADGGVVAAETLATWDRGEVTLSDSVPTTMRDYAALALKQSPNADRVMYLSVRGVPLFLVRIGGRYHDVAGVPVTFKRKEATQ